jgi:hypothetical protein
MDIKHTSTTLGNISSINHGFFYRRCCDQEGDQGGFSDGLYQSLNCGAGSDDDPQAVQKNRAVIADNMNVEPGNLVSLYQIHSPRVVVVDEAWSRANAPQADAMVSITPGIALGILTADCAPVLFSNSSGSVIGAAHAGWKGAVGGVVEATIAAMVELGAEKDDIYGVVGPCIRPESYEVGADMYQVITTQHPINAQFFDKGKDADHYQFDLPSYVLVRLASSGIGMVEDTPGDTYSDEDKYFSYRRATHRGETDYGRQISAISINQIQKTG